MKIADLHVLLKVAELHFITAAANQLDMSSSAASVSLKRVEQELGAQLFVRNHKAIAPDNWKENAIYPFVSRR
ncbi:LysR family transcriptional regulator [Paraglaciecola sp. Hal342]